jgi:4'-phosphopantetheinyl transferase
MRDQIQWSIAPTNPKLSNGEVHIWRVALDQSTSEVERLAAMLSADEQARSQRLRYRDAFIVGRGSLREILSRYLAIAPHQLQFRYESKGKPVLESPDSLLPLQFNLSHSQNWMLCAVTQSRRVGIDLEFVRPIADLAALTQRFFSAQEHEAIQALPIEQHHRSFFRFWTAKEAILKALGDGLTSLNAVELTETLQLVRLGEFSVANWWLQSFIPEPEFEATIAVEWGDQTVELPSLHFWHW